MNNLEYEQPQALYEQRHYNPFTQKSYPLTERDTGLVSTVETHLYEAQYEHLKAQRYGRMVFMHTIQPSWNHAARQLLFYLLFTLIIIAVTLVLITYVMLAAHFSH